MAKSRGADAMLETLAAIKHQSLSPQVRAQLAEALKSKFGFIVAKAAELARQFKFVDLYPELAAAFERFLHDPKFPDPGCAAKVAITRTALELDCPAEQLYLTGIRHVQMEGSFGPPVDVASELRGLCALGLVQIRHRGVMPLLVDLLMDDEPTAQIGAVRALASTGREDAALLLRLKVLAGDREPDVLAECFMAMLQLAPADSMPFVERYLDAPEDSLRDGAALAIGASRLSSAVAILCSRYSFSMDRDFRPTLLLALATCRSTEAIDFLVGLIASEAPPAAGEAVAALALYRHDATLRQRVEKAVADRNSDSLSREFAFRFGGAGVCAATDL